MTGPVVCDASALTALLLDSGPDGSWVTDRLDGADLLDLAIEFWPYELLARRAGDHRRNLSIYDAGYVALAELLRLVLVTLDRRIAGAPGLSCSVLAP